MTVQTLDESASCAGTTQHGILKHQERLHFLQRCVLFLRSPEHFILGVKLQGQGRDRAGIGQRQDRDRACSTSSRAHHIHHNGHRQHRSRKTQNRACRGSGVEGV